MIAIALESSLNSTKELAEPSENLNMLDYNQQKYSYIILVF